MAKPHAHIRLDFAATCSIGPGKIGLLEGIERCGSLSAAARALGMSYRRAWLLLHNTNEGFREPVVKLSVGGKDGGGTQLTDFGRRLVADYRAFAASVDALAAEAFADLHTSGRSVVEREKSPRRVARALPRRARTRER
jgi:molybdate transport system regulatory protein